MAKMTKQQIRNLGIALVVLVGAYWFWKGQQTGKEHGGAAVKEHAGKEHGGQTPTKEHGGK